MSEVQWQRHTSMSQMQGNREGREGKQRGDRQHGARRQPGTGQVSFLPRCRHRALFALRRIWRGSLLAGIRPQGAAVAVFACRHEPKEQQASTGPSRFVPNRALLACLTCRYLPVPRHCVAALRRSPATTHPHACSARLRLQAQTGRQAQSSALRNPCLPLVPGPLPRFRLSQAGRKHSTRAR